MTRVINETFGDVKLLGVKRGDAYVGQVFTEMRRSAQIGAKSVGELRDKLKAEAACETASKYDPLIIYLTGLKLLHFYKA